MRSSFAPRRSHPAACPGPRSKRGTIRLFAPVAQWIEYWPPKPGVAGSIPAGRAIFRSLQGLLHWTSRKLVLPYAWQGGVFSRGAFVPVPSPRTLGFHQTALPGLARWRASVNRCRESRCKPLTSRADRPSDRCELVDPDLRLICSKGDLRVRHQKTRRSLR